MYLSSLEGVVSIMVHRSAVLTPLSLAHSNSLCHAEAPLLSPLRKLHPVCTMTAIRAVALATEEVVAIRNRPSHAVWKPC